ncbi:MAG TPA: hypothetical protein VF487_15470 [Chitinophagaceae bacterium]
MSSLNEYEFNMEVLNTSHEFEYEGEGEMINELMSVSNEYEFENFLGKIWDTAKRVYKSPQGQAIKKDFIAGAKSFGKKMFPSVGRNLGSYFGGADGAKYGGQIASAAGNWLLGDEEQEAVDYVRVIRKAANYLNRAISSGVSMPPREIVTQAINQAARPIINQRRTGYTPNSTTQKQGRWIRQGNKLILQGAK